MQHPTYIFWMSRTYLHPLAWSAAWKIPTTKPLSVPLPHPLQHLSLQFPWWGPSPTNPRRPPGPWWSGESPRWYGHRATESKQDTGGWRDGGKGIEGWECGVSSLSALPGEEESLQSLQIQSSHKLWTALRFSLVDKALARQREYSNNCRINNPVTGKKYTF